MCWAPMLRCGWAYHLHFTDEKAEGWRGKGTCPGVKEPGHQPALSLRGKGSVTALDLPANGERCQVTQRAGGSAD